ncbi:MAG: lactate racemase domain-containing protein [Candidatus Saccharicenans sp.]|nr:lactate racemase domain-containing protein [Candidatus Saccharicenans sp.]
MVAVAFCPLLSNTRSCPMAMLFRMLYPLFAPHVKSLDFLIALGTHPSMSESAIFRHFGITSEEKRALFPKVRFLNHAWNDPAQLSRIGTISQSEMEVLSEGRISQAVPITVNRVIFEYDQLILLGPTFPHEVVGFSGGNKYFFPKLPVQFIESLELKGFAFHTICSYISASRFSRPFSSSGR